MDAMPSASPIQRSFEIAAARCDDLTPLVYARLFRDRPETTGMFRQEAQDLVKGSMLAFAVDAMLDFAGERTGAFRMIACEAISHDGYGTPRDLFLIFFEVIGQTVRDLLGPDWNDEMADAWQQMLVAIQDHICAAAPV